VTPVINAVFIKNSRVDNYSFITGKLENKPEQQRNNKQQPNVVPAQKYILQKDQLER